MTVTTLIYPLTALALSRAHVPAHGGHATAWWVSIGIPVCSGVLVAAIVAFCRALWVRRPIPTALTRAVHRKTYLDAVLRESNRADVVALDVLAPRLTPATDKRMADIQAAWRKINARGGRGVRVLILDNDHCLKGGAELLCSGIEVRVARRELGADALSFHLFDGHGETSAIINHHEESGARRRTDRPIRLNGTAVSQPIRKNFESLWEEASLLERVIADQVIDKAGRSQKPEVLSRVLSDTTTMLRLDPSCTDRVLRHLAFQSNCSVVLITGLPGAGKSQVRRDLALKLEGMGIKSRELSDYVYAFRDYVHSRLQLEPLRGAGFEAGPNGAFTVRDEHALQPALQALVQEITASLRDSEVVLAEFARSDIAGALGELDNIRQLCHVIHVAAPDQLRQARLSKRRDPPESSVDGMSLVLTPSDNHLLPSIAERSLYAADDIDRLVGSSRWRGRVTEIDNGVDDGGGKINTALDQFLDSVIRPYARTTLPGLNGSAHYPIGSAPQISEPPRRGEALMSATGTGPR